MNRGIDLEFEDYILLAGNLQTKWLAGKASSEAAIRLINDKDIFIGLTEKFDLSMILLKDLYAPTLNIGYQRLKIAKDRTIEEYLFSSRESMNMIKDANREDLALYKYVQEKLFPLYCKRFGEGLKQKLGEYQSQQSGFNNLNIMLNKVYREIVYKPFRRYYQLNHQPPIPRVKMNCTFELNLRLLTVDYKTKTLNNRDPYKSHWANPVFFLKGTRLCSNRATRNLN